MQPLMICLHAANSNIEIIDRAIQGLPFRIQHEVDLTLIQLIRTKEPLEIQKAYVQRKLHDLLRDEPAFIFITCTNYVALLDQFKLTLPVPIVKIDEILFEQMKDIQTPIQMLFSNKETIPGTMKRLHQFIPTGLDIEIVQISDVFEWFLAGHKLEHDQKVLSKLLELATFEKTIIVAQLSMANVTEIYGKLSGNPVITPISALRSYMQKLLV